MNWDLRAAEEKMAREQKERREKETAKKIERERIAARVQAEAARRQESSSNSSLVYRHQNVNPSPREDNFIPLEMKTSCRIEQITRKMDEVVNEDATLEKLIKFVNLAEVIVNYVYNRKTQNDNFIPLKMKPCCKSEENEGKKDELVDDAAAFELFSKLAKALSDELMNDSAAYEVVLKLTKALTQEGRRASEAKENKDDDNDDDGGDDLDKKKDGKYFLKRKGTLKPSLEMPEFILPESVIEYKTRTNQNTEESATKNIIRRDQPPSSTFEVSTRKIAVFAEREANRNRNESNGDKKDFLKPSSSASVTSTKHIVDRNRDDNNGVNKVHKKSYVESVMGTERPRTEKEGGYTNKGTNMPPFQLPESPLEFLSRRYIPRIYLPRRYLPQCSNSETLTGHPSDDQGAKTGEIETRASKPPFRLPESPHEFLSRRYTPRRRYLSQCSNSEPLTGHSSGSDDQEVKTGEIGMSNSRKKTEEVCPHSRIDHDLDRSRTGRATLHSSKYSIRDIISRNQPPPSASRTSTRQFTAWPNNRGKENKWIDDRCGNNFYKPKGFRSSESSNRTITYRFWTKERNQLPSASATSSGDYSSEEMKRIGNRKKLDLGPVLKHLELRQSSTYEEKKNEEKEKHCGGERSEGKDGDSDEGDNGSMS